MKIFLSTLLALALVSGAQAQTSMLLPENSITHVSDHVSAIVGFPNIAIVVGSRATLVVDTGMGARNGAIVMRAVDKLSKNPKLFLTTTHFHPEHALGEQAFPPNTILIRPTVQQQEMDQYNKQFIDMFNGFSAAAKELLKDVKVRTPDVLFDREATLDLGGVTARLFWLGPAHTRGDELIFVKEDSVLISGDVVQSKIIPNMPNDEASPKNWIAILDKLEPLKPRIVLPDHGPLGDGSLIAKEKAYLVDIRDRSLALKRKGVSADDAAKQVTADMKAKYPDWTTMGPAANIVKRVYAEN
jgi:glyoxylase-like metal-dependent hydrolase (beta-lactamase superfamily II)